MFSAQVVKANARFSNRKPPQEKPYTEKLWIYAPMSHAPWRLIGRS